MLEFRNVSLTREGRLVLKLDLEVASPGITMIMGANGAGKSLLLQLAHGLIAPDHGHVTWNQAPVTQTRRKRGFLFQKTPILRRSVSDNLRFPLQVAGVEAGERVQDALKMAKLENRADAPAALLSGGEQSRMALARCLILNPEAVLLDEPAAALDPTATKALEEMVLDVARRGIKVLMTTHNLGQARRLADDVVFLDNGTLIEKGPATSFFDEPRTQKARGYLKGEL